MEWSPVEEIPWVEEEALQELQELHHHQGIWRGGVGSVADEVWAKETSGPSVWAGLKV